MAFEKKVPDWNAEGTEPPESLKSSGFAAGYKPPASYFNWFWNRISKAVKELQEKAASAEDVTAHKNRKDNPHGVTAAQVGAAPSKHASQHGASGSDPITPDMIGAAAAKHGHAASEVDGLATVATSGSYKDLSDKPTIPAGTTVDTVLSSTSTNPVQNKVVHAELAGKAPSSHNQAASTITAGTFAGKVQGNTTAMATLSNAQLRDIYAGTADLTAGTSSLPTGTLYFVYE